jgi:hypothetical protein
VLDAHGTVSPVGGDPTRFHLDNTRADMDLWDTIKALRRQCPMVYLLFMAVLA